MSHASDKSVQSPFERGWHLAQQLKRAALEKHIALPPMQFEPPEDDDKPKKPKKSHKLRNTAVGAYLFNKLGAVGIPDRSRMGDHTKMTPDELVDYVVHKHDAQRAGLHYDVRIGGPEGLYSWAVRKGMPEPGQKHLALQQPVHARSYARFHGRIEQGYGAGKVDIHDTGKVLITGVKPDHINFVVAHHKMPETFTLARTPSKQGGGNRWLLINTTPVNAAIVLNGTNPQRKSNRLEDWVGSAKVRYKTVPTEDVDKLFDGRWMVSEKIDGAAAINRLFRDKIETLSYRTSKKGDRPIVHTYRMGKGSWRTNQPLPDELVGSILRGELYGERKGTGGQAIPPQELGGILNASVAKSLEKQKAQRVKMREAVFKVLRLGKQQTHELGPIEQRELVKKVLPYLPKDVFHAPEETADPGKAKAMWAKIRAGEWPRTSEGIVATPLEGGSPVKVKLRPETDVYVRSIFAGEGKYKGRAAGGFWYSTTPDGPVVGKVGTGLDDATRLAMMRTPDDFVGRWARVESQGAFPDSGALRAPSFISLHEDYSPLEKMALPLNRAMMAARRQFATVGWSTAKALAAMGRAGEGVVLKARTADLGTPSKLVFPAKIVRESPWNRFTKFKPQQITMTPTELENSIGSDGAYLRRTFHGTGLATYPLRDTAMKRHELIHGIVDNAANHKQLPTPLRIASWMKQRQVPGREFADELAASLSEAKTIPGKIGQGVHAISSPGWSMDALRKGDSLSALLHSSVPVGAIVYGAKKLWDRLSAPTGLGNTPMTPRSSIEKTNAWLEKPAGINARALRPLLKGSVLFDQMFARLSSQGSRDILPALRQLKRTVRSPLPIERVLQTPLGSSNQGSTLMRTALDHWRHFRTNPQLLSQPGGATLVGRGAQFDPAVMKKLLQSMSTPTMANVAAQQAKNVGDRRSQLMFRWLRNKATMYPGQLDALGEGIEESVMRGIPAVMRAG